MDSVNVVLECVVTFEETKYGDLILIDTSKDVDKSKEKQHKFIFEFHEKPLPDVPSVTRHTIVHVDPIGG